MDKKEIKKNLENKKILFLSTFNNKFEEGIIINELTKLDEINKNKNNFSIRIISISEEFFNKFTIDKEPINNKMSNNSQQNKLLFN